MPALAKPPAILPRFVPHTHAGADAGAGTFLGSTARAITKSPDHYDNLDRLAHDARNVLSGLMLYSELLATPGVLNPQHGHYARELQGIADAASQILEQIIEGAAPQPTPASKLRKVSSVSKESKEQALPTATAVPLAAVSVTDAAADLRCLQPLLAAIAGPGVQLSVATMPCNGRTALAVEDLTRILINLVRNAADAMPSGGHVRVTAQYSGGLSFIDPSVLGSAPGPTPDSVLLTVSDDGPGIPEDLRGQVFDLGFSTHKDSSSRPSPRRRGMGLSIVRNLVVAAGGTVRVTASHTGGAR
ncbi:MAG: sensor histidine kinase, partial [Acidobacteriaceae bacterium]